MKKNKILLGLFSGLSLTPAIALAGCSCNKESESEKIAEAIIKPSESNQQVKLTDLTFTQALKQLSDNDRKNELLYDLFISFTLKGNGDYRLQSNDSFATLYRNNVVSIKTNITKSSLSFKDNVLYCNFLGYVSFVFLKEYSGTNVTYKADDYVMLTFDINNQPVEINEDKCSLKYSVTDTKFTDPCIGFAKIRYNEGREVMKAITFVDTKEYIITNSHNWVK